MKKLLLFLFLAITFAFSASAQQWVNFSSSAPAAPEVNVTTSNAQTVTFEVTLPGIFTQDTVVKGMAFTRLIISGGSVVNPAGSPELPVLSYKVAIPDCDAAVVSYQIVSSQILPSCWVYPVPEIIFEPHPDEYNIQVEQFSFNANAYAQPRTIEPTATISSFGSLRNQQYAEITFSPVEFCPVAQQLYVIDKITITITFTNPVGDLIQELGIFAGVASAAFINYNDGGHSIEPPVISHQDPAPFVKFINLQDTAQACKIVCDYLIITESKFFKPNDPTSQLRRLAEHRKFLNGYDVAIVNVSQILGLNFEYEGYPDPEFMKEQKMRTFIRRVYEGKNARHIADEHLAFVLLVGDNYEGNTGMPTGYDHNLQAPYNEGLFASDYYFCCVTKIKTGPDAGKYDDIGDLAIGRFSVEIEQHLFNMVHKTIEFEREYIPKAWRKTAGFTYGSFHGSTTRPQTILIN